MNCVFLYTELAGYSIACMKVFLAENPTAIITVIRWPVNKEAPFEFDFTNITVKDKSEFSEGTLLEYIQSVNPSVIICSGWIDKEYKAICKTFYKKIPTVLALDNHWNGTLKQRIAQVLSPFFIKKAFSNVWVPGAKQYTYARKLGFKPSVIQKGFYAADVALFTTYYEQLKKNAKEPFPKRIVYVGRYITHKGIFDLWNAFIQLQNENPNEWELWCVGTGDQWENRVLHPQIKHLGFLQPSEFSDVIKETSIYILPSHFEPWGVSLHEFAAAGYPIIGSDKIGSAEQFLKAGENGFSFQSGNIEELKTALQSAMNLDATNYAAMQQKSLALAQTITPTLWAETLMRFAQPNSKTQ